MSTYKNLSISYYFPLRTLPFLFLIAFSLHANERIEWGLYDSLFKDSDDYPFGPKMLRCLTQQKDILPASSPSKSNITSPATDITYAAIAQKPKHSSTPTSMNVTNDTQTEPAIALSQTDKSRLNHRRKERSDKRKGGKIVSTSLSQDVKPSPRSFTSRLVWIKVIKGHAVPGSPILSTPTPPTSPIVTSADPIQEPKEAKTLQTVAVADCLTKADFTALTTTQPPRAKKESKKAKQAAKRKELEKRKAEQEKRDTRTFEEFLALRHQDEAPPVSALAHTQKKTLTVPRLPNISPILAGTIEADFISQSLNHSELRSNLLQGYYPAILYSCNIARTALSFKRITSEGYTHLFKIKKDDEKDPVVYPQKSDRIFSIKDRDLDFLLRNGNKLYFIKDEFTEELEEEKLQEIVDKLAQSFSCLPPFSCISPADIKAAYPAERNILKHVYFSVQPAIGSNFTVKTNDRGCWLVDTQEACTEEQVTAFDIFKDFYLSFPLSGYDLKPTK